MDTRAKRSKRFVILLAGAIVTTLLFLLSTVFQLRRLDAPLDVSIVGCLNARLWTRAGLVHAGASFTWSIDFADPNAASTNQRLHRSPQTIVARSWHAGFEYFPGAHTELHETDRWISTIGIDGFLNQSNTYFSVGVFGLYPSVLMWLLVWLCRGKRIPAGHCPTCGYDLRADTRSLPGMRDDPRRVESVRRAGLLSLLLKAIKLHVLRIADRITG